MLCAGQRVALFTVSSVALYVCVESIPAFVCVGVGVGVGVGGEVWVCLGVCGYGCVCLGVCVWVGVGVGVGVWVCVWRGLCVCVCLCLWMCGCVCAWKVPTVRFVCDFVCVESIFHSFLAAAHICRKSVQERVSLSSEGRSRRLVSRRFTVVARPPLTWVQLWQLRP